MHNHHDSQHHNDALERYYNDTWEEYHDHYTRTYDESLRARRRTRRLCVIGVWFLIYLALMTLALTLAGCGGSDYVETRTEHTERVGIVERVTTVTEPVTPVTTVTPAVTPSVTTVHQAITILPAPPVPVVIRDGHPLHPLGKEKKS